MDDFDEADFDGDGEFDAIDITLLEEGENNSSKHTKNQNTGCCLPFFIAGSSVTGAAFVFTKLLT